MPSPRFRIGAVAVALVLALLAACDDKPSRPNSPGDPEKPPRPPPRDDAALGDLERPDGGAAAAAAIASTRQLVAEIRSEKLDVAPRRVPAERLAFGKGKLAQLTEQALIVRDTSKFSTLSTLPVSEPRRVTTLADGTLLVAGKSDVLTVPGDATKTERYPRIPLFVDSLIFADKRDKTKLWVLHGIDPTLYPYQLGEAGKLDTLDLVQLPELDQKGFAALKDGSFVYTAKEQLHRFFPGGKTWKLALPPGAEVWRILTTKRIDELWLARADGKLELAQITANRLVVKKTLEAPGAFDIASNDSDIALLRLERGEGGKRSWKLMVFDSGGKDEMLVELPLDPVKGTGEDWVRDLTRNRAVVLSSYAPLVAVGGPTWLSVWNYEKNERVMEPP
jgi:hypothetical protein